jgi:TPR repeat protein
MSGHDYQQQQQQRPQLGATFYPGGSDDFNMPELISPAPQRIMPEVPSNMQEGLANLELEARNRDRRQSSQSTVSSVHSPYTDQFPSKHHARQSSQASIRHPPSGRGYTASYEHTNASAYQNINRGIQQAAPIRYNGSSTVSESPKFSPFPKPRDAGPNVPMSDEEKEGVLEGARTLVLNSNDPEMQLAWAQDALSWVEVASQSYTRQNDGQNTRTVTPKIEHQLRVDAISIVNFLADQYHPKAEFMKAMWLEFGKFEYRVDKKEAFLGYRRAAEKGYARAEYRIGMQYEASNDSANAIKHYSKGVSMKDSASNYRLGMMTLLGQHGQPQDYQRGADLIRFAADTADENAPQGAYVYGMLLARELPNITIPEVYLLLDMSGAKLFIEKAAYLGFAKAQLKMGQAYELCQLGCEFDPALSLHYNALAARQGEAEADMAISKWFLCGYEGIFEKNEELAFTYAQRAAQTKMATAEFAMGYFYEIGMYVSTDLREAQSWYQKAAEHGNKDAFGRIESISRNKTLSKNDHEKVAISRIKSQYGSQRGGRPERFKERRAPMPVMAEDRIDMPDPSARVESRSGHLRPQGSSPPVVRPISTAPYPEDDVAPSGHGSTPLSPYYNPNLRPSSIAGPQADRSSSAFGIRPPPHQSTMPSYPHDSTPTEQARPSTSMGNMAVPNGRGRIVSTGWEPQLPAGYRAPSPGRPLNLPQIDVGRPANFEQVTNPNRFQKPQANMNKLQPMPPLKIPNPGYGSDPRYDSRPMDKSRQKPVPTLQRPERLDPISQNPSRASQRPTQPISSQGPDSRASPATPTVHSTSTPTAPKPSKGPATFEEMGIPAGKNDGDCIVM